MNRRRPSFVRTAALWLAGVALVIGMAACSSGSQSGYEAAPLDSDAILLDVRTPSEFAEGHLEGARLLDFSGGQFEAAIPGMDPDAEYYLYCRSGNRAGQAMKLMEKAGIVNVTNLGSVEKAAQVTGLPIVTD
ncbi:rhodanese-like domain-containing protein [Brooklawnia sp.]|uniref:rhodanese-like domain-containing protein n=1 Tax=Brooklawnia sp. TaxID=2699740 RepID=UPI00311D83DE